MRKNELLEAAKMEAMVNAYYSLSGKEKVYVDHMIFRLKMRTGKKLSWHELLTVVFSLGKWLVENE